MYQNFNYSTNPLEEHFNTFRAKSNRNNSNNYLIVFVCGVAAGLLIMYFIRQEPQGIDLEDYLQDRG